MNELLARPQSDRIILRDGKRSDAALPDFRELDASSARREVARSVPTYHQPRFLPGGNLAQIRQIFGFTGLGRIAGRTAGMMATPAIAKRPPELQAFRIAPGDSNYFACMLDPLADGVSFTLVVEIFEPGGRTPPNSHAIAEEAFFVLAGTGRAIAGSITRDIGPGDVLVLRPGTEHVVENTGPGKLYCLTMMTPNEGFAELIRAGTSVTLTGEDRAVITGARAA